jgi:hypothetical protein
MIALPTTATQAASAKAMSILPQDALASIKGGVSAAQAGLTVAKLAKQALSASLTTQLLPMKAVMAVLSMAIEEAKSKASIPTDLLMKSSELGDLNRALGQTATDLLEPATNLLFDIERLVASQMSINMEIAAITSTIAFFDNFLITINLALASTSH